MLQEISWTDYWTIVSVAIFIYYIVIVLVFFRQDIQQLIKGQQRVAIMASPVMNDEVKATEQQFEAANNLTIELQEILSRKLIKEEMMMAVGQRLQKYGTLKATAFQVSINNFLVTETAKRSIHLSEEDLRVLW